MLVGTIKKIEHQHGVSLDVLDGCQPVCVCVCVDVNNVSADA